VTTETTYEDGTTVVVNVTTPERANHEKDGSSGKRAASYAALGKSPSGGGRRVMSRNSENISPPGHHSKVEGTRSASGRAVGGKRIASSGVREGKVRKTSRERLVSAQRS